MTYNKAIARGEYARAIAILDRRDRIATLTSWCLYAAGAGIWAYLITGLLP
jgi:hypothetical protein